MKRKINYEAIETVAQAIGNDVSFMLPNRCRVRSCHGRFDTREKPAVIEYRLEIEASRSHAGMFENICSSVEAVKDSLGVTGITETSWTRNNTLVFQFNY